MLIQHLIFCLFAGILVGAATLVVTARQPVYSALCLILAFFASAVIWILLEADFLALILILVYVGAVMTLFLFVVMMLNLDIAPERAHFVRYAPIIVFGVSLLLAGICYVVGPANFGATVFPIPASAPAEMSSAADLGRILYTEYVYPFELAAILLLIAIVAAVSLNLRKARSKKQNIKEQLQTDRHERLKLLRDLK